MSNFTPAQKIKIFTSLFRGRSDVYALRWEKWDGRASGYFPVYEDKSKKVFALLTDNIIEGHLRGYKTVGIYPLLQDNNSWFIAADFDGNNWIQSAERLLKQSNKYNLPVQIERSRSGNGGHVWWFFDSPYPAYKSRKIFLHLIKESKNVDEFDKEDNFDRLFPNQDYHSGKGLGNLIALPLQGQSRKEGNSIFLDPNNNFKPASDQWQFLNSIKRIPFRTLNHLFENFSNNKLHQIKIKYTGNAIPIIINSHIVIPKKYIIKQLSSFLTEKLNFFNNEYAIKQKIGLSVYGVEKYFKTIIKDDENVLMPRGFLDELVQNFNKYSVPYKIYDERYKRKEIKYRPTFTLFDYQKKAVDAFDKKFQGIMVAPSGSGKTIMALALISKKKQPAIIITHRKQIYDQWLERIEDFLQIPKRKIGQISGNKKSVQIPITVAMIQTLARADDFRELFRQFGLVIIDECQHMPAKMFRQVITQFNPYYLYGLTATPVRKHNDEKLIFIYLGKIIYEVPKNFNANNKKFKDINAKIIIKVTDLKFPYKVKTEDYQLLAKVLTFDSERNKLIAEDIKKEADKGKKCLILTERKDHIQIIEAYLKRDFEVITLTGDLTLRKKQEKIKQIESGHFQIIIATGQLLGEGTHFNNLDCLFLVYPFAFEGKLSQYIGRILHSDKIDKTIYDYYDKEIDYLKRMFKKRRKYYEKNFKYTK
ncbi:MAG: DEAD/DEAH box helicase family protein [Patescibacteria group bacterium]